MVHAGHSLEKDGFFLVGKLTDQAQEAEEEIQYIIDSSEWWTEEGVFDALDWLEAIEWQGVPVSASSTDAELSALVEPLSRRAQEDHGALVYDIYYALAYRRNELQEAEEE